MNNKYNTIYVLQVWSSKHAMHIALVHHTSSVLFVSVLLSMMISSVTGN